MNLGNRTPMHVENAETRSLREAIFEYTRDRMDMDPAPLDYPMTVEQLEQTAGETITESGLGGFEAFRKFTDVLAPGCLSVDHPGYLAFIPCAPTEAASLFDLVVSASSVYGGSWLEGSGAVYAENQVLAWLAREVGLPDSAGGVFVQGGTLGNLSALVTAREVAIRKCLETGKALPQRWTLICSSEAHSSLKTAATVMGIELAKVPVDSEGRMTGSATQEVLERVGTENVFAIVATAGTTNFGIVDRLDEIGEIATSHGIWYHIDGAYGLAGILAETTRPLFVGSSYADSFIVDPHKWLFAPFDACALVYRNPEFAKRAHTQHAEYLDTLTDSDEWNPSDYAIGLTRRARGLPLWFSLATHGVSAYRHAVTQGVELAAQIATEIQRRDGFELVRKPELSIVAFRKVGWSTADYERWSDRMLSIGKAFAVPSAFQGEPMMRFAIISPLTTYELLVDLLDEMERE